MGQRSASLAVEGHPGSKTYVCGRLAHFGTTGGCYNYLAGPQPAGVQHHCRHAPHGCGGAKRMGGVAERLTGDAMRDASPSIPHGCSLMECGNGWTVVSEPSISLCDTTGANGREDGDAPTSGPPGRGDGVGVRLVVLRDAEVGGALVRIKLGDAGPLRFLITGDPTAHVVLPPDCGKQGELT